MFETRIVDWLFIIPATLIWISALLVTALDFILIQGIVYSFGFVNLTGLTLGLIGSTIRGEAKLMLGRYFSVGLRMSKDHKLIRHGVYRYVRHPAYLGALLATFAIPLFFNSLYGFFVLFLLVSCYLYRIRIEEGMLIEAFGEEYRDYMKNSKKLIPDIC